MRISLQKHIKGGEGECKTPKGGKMLHIHPMGKMISLTTLPGRTNPHTTGLMKKKEK